MKKENDPLNSDEENTDFTEESQNGSHKDDVDIMPEPDIPSENYDPASAPNNEDPDGP